MNKTFISLLIIMLFLNIVSGNAFGQSKQQEKWINITSVVVDDKGTPIPDAIISGKQGAIEVKSNSEGKFSIDVPKDSKLLIEANGFDTKSLSVNMISDKIILIKPLFLMDENNLVNVAFGQAKKREIVGAVNAVNTKDITKYDNTQYIFDAIRSRIPGLLGNTNIRGIGNAVFIVDGFPRDISDINIEEVEQISVLKDANSAMLWGTQASNGVIIITTKRGQAQKLKVNVSMEKGMAQPVALPKYLGSADYMTLYNEALSNDGLPAAYADSTISHYRSGISPYRYPSVDYYSSEYLRSNKPFSKLLTEFSGGNEITRYYATVGWLHSGSLYALGQGRDASSDRFNVRGNVDFKVNDYISSFVDALVVIEGNKGPNGSYWSNAATLHPEYFSPVLPINLVKNGVNVDEVLAAKKINGEYILGGTSQYKDNAYGNMYMAGYNQNIQRTARFNTGINLDLKGITKGLKLKTYLSLDVYNAYTQSVSNTYAIYQPTWVSYGTTDSIAGINKVGTDASGNQQVLGDNGYTRRFGTYALLDYARTFKNVHSVTATFLGYFDNLNSNAVIIDQKNSHLALRATYDYKKKYFVDFSSAYVNGFKLEKGKKGGYSPSLGLAWVISEKDKGMINYLKLKGSAGSINYEFAGSNYRLYESTYGNGSTYTYYDGVRSNKITSISRSSNPDLTFEKMETINFGIEGYFFNKSVYLDGNVFANRNSGQVIQRSIYAPYVGNAYPYVNYNTTDYKGGELGINWSEKIGDFSFDLGANLLITDSKVIKRDETWSNSYQYRQGLPDDAMFGLEALGLFADQGEIDNSPSQKFGEVKPGDIKYKDQNGDGKIDADDEIRIGDSQANLSYGVTLMLKYKRLSLFAIGNGREGAQSMYSGSYFWVQGNGKYSEEVLNRWTPGNALYATYPRLTSKNSPNNFRTSTFWLYDNDYFTIDRVQLTYDVPERCAKKFSSKEVKLYVRGENLARFSKDADKRQLRIGSEPNYRSYAVGLRIMF